MQRGKKRSFWEAIWLKYPKEVREKSRECHIHKKGKRKVQGVSQSQATALPRHQEEEETDSTKQAQIEKAYEKHSFPNEAVL